MTETMTVKELRNLLLTYPDDLSVLATWEGVYATIVPKNIVIETPYKDDWTQEALIIDVEDNL